MGSTLPDAGAKTGFEQRDHSLTFGEDFRWAVYSMDQRGRHERDALPDHGEVLDGCDGAGRDMRVRNDLRLFTAAEN
jgi:hypothetical protein